MKPYYEEAGITVYCADCREVLPTLGAVDLILTDPPYGIRHKSSHVCETTTAHWVKSEIDGDSDESLRDFVLEWHPGDYAIFGSKKTSHPVRFVELLVWDKGPASGMGDLTIPFKPSFEFIYIGGRLWSGSRDEGVVKNHWIVTRASMGRVHPNEKPVSLFRYLLTKHPGTLILDPFMGSGTTLVAAKQLGRRAIGVDTEERYCEIAADRLRQSVFDFGTPEVQPEQLTML